MKSNGLFKYACAMAFVLAAAVPASAQVEVGVKGGLNLGKLTFDPPVPNEAVNRLDYGAGLFIEAAPDSKVGALIEMMYNRRGGRFKEGADHIDVIFQYFDINGFLNLRVMKVPGSSVHLFVGPSLGIKLKIEQKNVDETVEDFSDDFKTTGISLVAGASVSVGHLVLDGRYAHGMTNLHNEGLAGIIKTRTLSFLVGVRF